MLDRAIPGVFSLFAGVLASTATPAIGQDEGKFYFRNAGWTVESLVVDGRPIGCIARTRSTDDGTFAISSVGEREWKAAFKPRDGFKPKLKRSVTLLVDGRQIAKATGFVDKDGYASIGSLEPTAVRQLANGNSLEVETIQGRSSISLVGSAEAVANVEQCSSQLVSANAQPAQPTPSSAQAPDGVAQRRVPTQSIRPQGMPQDPIRSLGTVLEPPRPPTPAEIIDSYRARSQAQPQPQVQQPAPQQAPPARYRITDQEIDTLSKMMGSRDPATRAAGFQMWQQYMQKFGPRSEEEKADLEYKRALTEYIRRRIAEHTPPPARTPTHYSGTGIVVSRTGKVLTNAHVVRECSSIRVALAGRHSSEATVARRDDDNDLALLDTSLPPVDAPRFKLNVRTGEAVSVYGFPFADDLPSSGTFTQGIVSATAGLRDDARLFQLTAPVHPGNSGGPVLDAAGNVIGVIVLKFIKGENTSYAIKSSIAARFLEANGVKVEQRSAGAPSMTAPDLADSAKNFSVFIICQKKAS